MDQHGTYKLIKDKSLQTSPKTNECPLKNHWLGSMYSLPEISPIFHGTFLRKLGGVFKRTICQAKEQAMNQLMEVVSRKGK